MPADEEGYFPGSSADQRQLQVQEAVRESVTTPETRQSAEQTNAGSYCQTCRHSRE